MIKLIKNNYSFLVVFILILFKEPIYNLINIKKEKNEFYSCKLLKDEYNKLLEFNNIEINYDINYYNSKIIYKDMYNYLNEITISGGTEDGFQNNPVVYDNTLIGIIKKSNKNSSIVTLITNKNSEISVKVNKDIGILMANNNKLYVKNISNYSDINIGDVVYTSGLGNIEENIFIGTVKNIKLDNKKIEKIIEVDYKINIKNIGYVSVLEVSV